MRLFAQARDAAGRRVDAFDADTVAEVRARMCDRYGSPFTEVLATARLWVNGDEPSDGEATALRDGDEVAVLPPVSGGAGADAAPHR